MTNFITLANIYYVYFKNIILWCRVTYSDIEYQSFLLH